MNDDNALAAARTPWERTAEACPADCSPPKANGLRGAESLATLVPRFEGLLRAAGRRYGLTRDETEDAVQQTWLRLCENVAAVRDFDRLPGWLSTTVRRECLAVRRRRWREEQLEHLPEQPSSESDPVASVLRKERTEAVRDAVASLPTRERRLVCCLLTEEPLTYDEISFQLGMPRGSIGPIRARALQRMAGVLSQRGWS